MRADRASGRASGKQGVAASRNQPPQRVNGVLQPDPSATALNLRLLAFCIRRARQTGRALGCGASAGLAAAGSDAAFGPTLRRGNLAAAWRRVFGLSCSKSLGQLRSPGNDTQRPSGQDVVRTFKFFMVYLVCTVSCIQSYGYACSHACICCK